TQPGTPRTPREPLQNNASTGVSKFRPPYRANRKTDSTTAKKPSEKPIAACRTTRRHGNQQSGNASQVSEIILIQVGDHLAIFRKLVGMRENLICSTGVGIGSSWVGGGTIDCPDRRNRLGHLGRIGATICNALCSISNHNAPLTPFLFHT
ncbi:hypothetical protein, partial [Bifidobacterium catenulatum]|uniref:hypothetical protein n=1 Tax=Bifidobacterium catenulatum TaxID=1686 RepID=UPI00321AB9EE